MASNILGRVMLSDEDLRFVIGTLRNRDTYLTKRIPELFGEQKENAEIARDNARRLSRRLQELRKSVLN